MPREAAIFDLDRTLIAGSPTPILERHLGEAGIDRHRGLPLVGVLDRWYQQAGESPLSALAEQRRHRPAHGWPVQAVRRAGEAAADDLERALLPFVAPLLAEHRQAGRLLVLATSAPEPLVAPFAQRLGFDHVVATRWRDDGNIYTGDVDGPVVRGRGKLRALEAWAGENDVSLQDSYAYTDSFSDAALLAAVGHPVAVNPDPQLAAAATLRRWPVRHLDVPEGVGKFLGRELQEWVRPMMRPELVPYANIEFHGVENVPSTGPAIVAFNHRSYFDPTVLGLLSGRIGRPVRGLGKKELFDVPLLGHLARLAGGIRVERASGSDEPLQQAAGALQGGELIMIAPQGTIPRGRAFFEPELRGRWGTARLAQMTRAPVIPVGLWGTERVWPRSSRLPNVAALNRPTVAVRVGPPVPLGYDDVEADTSAIMSAISALLPDEARQRREPTPDELRRTFPPGYRGDPEEEVDRRPGTDTGAGR